MSVTVSAVPFFLLYTVGAGVIGFIQTANEIKANNQRLSDYHKRNLSYNQTNESFHVDDELMEKIYNKDFSTTIMDKDVLLKTLKEHGAVNIIENNDNISCDCEAFHLDFTKNSDAPYSLRISYNDDYNLEELVNDIGSEYTSNAQEISYNKIKERLEERNLEIEEEEIYDDNTIVLTVNLE